MNCTSYVAGRILAFRLLSTVLLTLSFGAVLLASPGSSLRVYFIDVEGGQATLFVAPGGQSLLIDTGWPANNGRDADRIVAAAKKAGLAKIDYVLITHFHMDHVGGLPQLTDRIPVGTVIDHGDNRESGDAPTLEVYKAYQELLATGKFKRLSVKPGDVLPLSGIHAEVISADGNLIEKPLPGAGAENPACQESETHPGDQTENPRSLGTLITFGKLRILDLGDLTWDKEMQLMCPQNKIGHVDLYIVSHHGWRESGSPALVHGIGPRVAIMDNGATKGGTPSAWDIIHSSPHLADLWQLHFSEEGAAAHNTGAPFIANLAGPDAGNYLLLTAHPDASFTVYNSRTRETKPYAAP